jgi:hypothetical protein
MMNDEMPAPPGSWGANPKSLDIFKKLPDFLLEFP